MPSRRLLTRHVPLVVLVIALLITGTLVAAKQVWDHREPEQPAGSTVPVLALSRQPLLAVGDGAPVPTRRGIRAALAPYLDEPELGRSVAARVVDAATGRELYGARTGAGVTPASVAKLATAVAALQALGPDTTFDTRVLLGTSTSSTTAVLVGGGDATLSSPRAPATTTAGYPPPARIADLARRTAAALRERGVDRVSVAVDDRLFAGPLLGPGWKPNYVPEGSVTPVAALSVDGGRLDPDDDPSTSDERATDPPITAGRTFAALLERAGVRVTGAVGRARPAPDAAELAVAQSPPVAALVVRMLQRSDNDLAEALFRHVAIAGGQPASFAGGAVAVRAALSRAGVDAGRLRLVDGSGLSVHNRVSAHGVTELLGLVADSERPLLRPVLEGLPVGAFSGTLSERYRTGPRLRVTEPGAGLVRAKTGTLTGVSTLAGLVLDGDGRLLVFALFADSVPEGGGTAAQDALDDAVGALARCGCG